MAERIPGWAGDDVVAAAQQGDPASVAALVSAAHPHVYRFAHLLCVSREDAEDAAQEALVVLFCKIGTLRATGALASWMFQIVRRECIRRARLIVPGRSSAQQGAWPSAEDDALRKMDIARVAAVIADLPADQRQVLILRDIQAVPGRAVAESLGLSSAAMKSRLHRARSAVRAGLADQEVAS